MTPWPPNPGWQFRLDNPDFRGWAVVAAYVLAAGWCGRRAARKAPSSAINGTYSSIWWLLAAGLVFLGINKQLNLQTLLIDLGRRASLAFGWYDERRRVQYVFCAVFTLAAVVVIWLMRRRFRLFFAQNPWALAGVVVLVFFVLFRAASINHVFQRMGFRQDDKQWTWLLEIGGSACLAVAAMADKPAKQ